MIEAHVPKGCPTIDSHDRAPANNELGGRSDRRLASLAGAVGALVVEHVLDLLCPRGCAACDEPLTSRAALCRGCASSVERVHDSGIVRAFAEHGGALATAVHRLKYQGRSDLAAPLGALLATVEPAVPVDLVVPVPLHPLRLCERGFNQSALLAARVARARSVPLAPLALRRLRASTAQAKLRRAERLESDGLEFVAPEPRLFAGKSVLLVDDVVTTGATLSACARAVLEAGAQRVCAVALTRAVLDSGGSVALGTAPRPGRDR
jgi:ComF family protein